MVKKYELTDETIVIGGITIRRIRALKAFADVNKGDLGGWVQSEENLSHAGNCWIYGNAAVFDLAEVTGNAKVCGSARVFEAAKITENACVFDYALIYGNAKVCGTAQVCGSARVYGNALIYGNAKVCRCARVFDHAHVSGYAMIGNDKIRIGGSGCITDATDYFVIGPIGSRESYTTFYRSEKGITVTCGCFTGTLGYFEKKVIETHGDNMYAKQYLYASEFARNLLSIKKPDGEES